MVGIAVVVAASALAVAVSAPALPVAVSAAEIGFVPASSTASRLPERPASTELLAVANWWRSFAGRYPDGSALPPLEWSSERAESAQRHVDYLAWLRTQGSSYCGHGVDDDLLPTDSGDRGHNVLDCYGRDGGHSIDRWMETPLHGRPFVDPRVTHVGQGVNDIASAAGFVWDHDGDPTEVFTYPANGGTMPILTWLGGEIPDPSVACPPADSWINGPPVFLFVPQPVYDETVDGFTYEQFGDLRLDSWSFTDDAGSAVPACFMSGTEVMGIGESFGGAYIFPREPLVAGRSYRALVSYTPVDLDGGVLGDTEVIDLSFDATDHHLVGSGPRLLDTRLAVWETVYTDEPEFSDPFGGRTLELPVTATSGVDGGASAVVLNVTVTNPVSDGFVTVWPCGSPRPLASNLNYVAGQTVANSVVTALGDGGRVCFYALGWADLVVDLQGWFGSGFVARQPERVLETRLAGQIGHSGGRPPAGTTLTLDVADPADVLALNVTAVAAAAPGFLTVWPCGEPRPNASNVNYSAGDTVATLVLATAGVDGTVCIYTHAATDVVVDLAGSAVDGVVTGATPWRALDTRPAYGPIGFVGSRPAAGTHVAVDVGTTDATAVVVSVAAVDPDGPGHLTVWPCDEPMPLASNLNHRAGQTIANTVVAAPSEDGTVCVFTYAAADLIVDVLAVVP